MCGLFGYVGGQDYLGDTWLSDLNSSLSKRGPDNTGYYLDNLSDVHLVHYRLSIMDLSDSGNQPLFNKSKTLVLIFNGEIYNFKDIRALLIEKGYVFFSNSDTEVVLNSFIEWGANCANYLEGMFAFAVYSTVERKITLVRDRLGIKPLIYFHNDKGFGFCSEILPLMNLNLINRSISIDALSQFLTNGSVQQPFTISNQANYLKPGYILEYYIDSDSFDITRYYSLIESALKSKSSYSNYQDAVLDVRESLENATKSHLVSDVEVGAFLSGGIDSSAVAALMQKHYKGRLKTFSLGFSSESGVADETDFAMQTADFLDTNHTNIIIRDNDVEDVFLGFLRNLDQPSIDGFNTYLVSMAASKSVRVAISGLGGDEIFGGYRHFEDLHRYSLLKNDKLDRLINKFDALSKPKVLRKIIYFFSSPEESIRLRRAKKINSSTLSFPLQVNREIHKHNHLSNIQRASIFELDNYLLSTLLRDADVLSMAHSLELRPILLDHKLVEKVFSIQDDFKIQPNRKKPLFTDSVSDLLPADIFKRPKLGFELPFAFWLNSVLNDKALIYLDTDIAKQIFSKKFLNKLIKRGRNKKFLRSDWKCVVLLGWMIENSISAPSYN